MNNTGKRSLTLLLIISIIGGIFVSFVPFSMSNRYDKDDILRKQISDFVNNSIYGRDADFMGDYANYYIHSIKKSYEKSKRTSETGETITEEVSYDDEDYSLENVVNSKENTRSSENVRYRDIYLSNDDNFKRKLGYGKGFNPEEIKFTGGQVVIKGRVSKDGLVLNDDHTSEITPLSRQVSSTLNDMIRNNFRYILQDERIESIEFAYAINVDNGLLEKDMDRWISQIDISSRMGLSVIISSIIFILTAIIFKYENQNIDEFYNKIIKVPVEIVICLVMVLMAISSEVFSPDYYFYSQQRYIDLFYSNNFLIALGAFIVIFCTGLTIFYAVYGLKGIRDGFLNSKLVRNSIIYKIFSPLFRRFKLTDFKTTNVVLTFILILFLGYLLIAIFAFNRSLLVLAYTFLVFLVTGFILKFFEDIKLVNEATKKISEGDFKTKIDENIRFSEIAKNINSIGSDLDNKVEHAVKSERMKTELITNVSHDLKTPLTSIINYSELINSPETTDEDIKKYAEIINDKSNQLKILVENLFEISKVSSKNIDLELEDVDLYQLTLQVLGSYEDKYNSKNIETIIKADEIPYIVNIDGNQTSRILDNLFSNIDKYAMENSRVYINFENIADKTELIIKNISKYPLNISEEELMERFIRGDASRNTEGSGLGLSIAKSLTEIQGGEFNLEIDGDLFKTTIIF